MNDENYLYHLTLKIELTNSPIFTKTFKWLCTLQLREAVRLLNPLRLNFLTFVLMYISITGLKPKNLLSTFRFWTLAIPSFRQAQTAEGNTYAQVKRINGFQCTLSAWNSRDDMLKFMRSGVHLKAMKSFNKIATGRTYGFESDTIPNWEEAFKLLQEKGKNY